MSALQKLRGKPHMSKEIAYKLSEDINKGVLKQMFAIKKQTFAYFLLLYINKVTLNFLMS